MNKFLLVLCYVCGTGIIMYIVNLIFKKLRRKSQSVSLKFLNSLIQVIIVTVSVFFLLGQFEATKEVSKQLLQSSSLIIAILTFACQKVLANVIAGVVLSSSKPFDIGDKISILSGSTTIATGVVVDMTVRHTTIQMIDGRCVIIPNGTINDCSIINNNTLDDNGYTMTFECTYDSDVDLAMKLVEEEIEKHPLTINDNEKHKTGITCSNLGANGFELKATVWSDNIANNFQACSDLRISVFKSWKLHNISMPYNVTELTGTISVNK